MTTMDRPLYAIAPTQFEDNGELDVASMARNTEWLADAGIDKFLLTGAYGEFQSLTDEERVAVVQAVSGTGRASSIMAGASHPSTAATERLARRLFDAGADLVMVAPPMIAELERSDIDRHFDHLGERFESGLVVYNNPVFGVELSAADLARIASLGPYVAVKQGTVRLGQVIPTVEAIKRAGSAMKVYAAADLAALATLASGFDGLTSTNCWAYPRAFVALVDAAREDDVATMRHINSALAPYADAVREMGQPRTIKAALVRRGGSGTRHVRLPYAPLTDAEHDQLATAMDATDERLAELGL